MFFIVVCIKDWLVIGQVPGDIYFFSQINMRKGYFIINK
jgi:hypothetical protein